MSHHHPWAGGRRVVIRGEGQVPVAGQLPKARPDLILLGIEQVGESFDPRNGSCLGE